MDAASDRNTRQRVGRACDNCRQKKIRCDGSRPCANCSAIRSACSFEKPYLRGVRRKTGKSSSSVQNGLALLESRTSELPQLNPESQSNGTHQCACDNQLCQSMAPVHSSRNSPEVGETDSSGHVVGRASGLNFLLRLHRRLVPESGSNVERSLYGFGDPSLPPSNEYPISLPSSMEAWSLVKTYFELASPTYRFLHRATVETWLSLIYNNTSAKRGISNSERAVLFTLFAQATRYIDAGSTGTNVESGMKYFQAAERLLSEANFPVNLLTAQALLGSCFYILTCSRLNHCWSLFGTTSRLVVALGLHRKPSTVIKSPGPKLDYIDIECRKRLFWCCYNLDKYLSAIMGRPSVFHDEDIDQDLPSVVQDSCITADGINASQSSTFCAMLGSHHHAKLGRILSDVLRNLYGIQQLSKDEKCEVMANLGEKVHRWKQSLPPFLDSEKILIYRPSFLDYRDRPEIRQNIERCLAAASLAITAVDRMAETGQLFAGSWFTQYHAFCAVVVLYTYTLRVQSEHPRTWIIHFRAAERCQGWISSLASPGTLAYRFTLIMEEYKSEVVRQVCNHCPHPADLESEGLSFDGGQPDIDTCENAHSGETGQICESCSEVHTFPESIYPNSFELPEWDNLYSLALDLA